MKYFLIGLVVIPVLGILSLLYKKQNAPKKLLKAKAFYDKKDLNQTLKFIAASFYLPIGVIKKSQIQHLNKVLNFFFLILEKESLTPNQDLLEFQSLINQNSDKIKISNEMHKRLSSFIQELEFDESPLQFIRDKFKLASKIKIASHLSAIGDIEKVEVISQNFKKTGSKEEVAVNIVCFEPDKDYAYYRFVTNNLGLSMLSILPKETETNIFDICCCSQNKDMDVIHDMFAFIERMLDQATTPENGNTVNILKKDGSIQYYLLYMLEQTSEALDYSDVFEVKDQNLLQVPLFTMIPIQEDEEKWIMDKNQEVGIIAEHIFRKWLEFRKMLPLGTLNSDSLLVKDLDHLNQMVEDLANQNNEFFSKNIDPEYVSIFQAYIKRHSKNSDQDIERIGLLVANGQYDEAIAEYEILIEKAPEDKYLFIDQIGAIYFFKEEYHHAFENYKIASEHKISSSDFNLWEVCELLYKKENNLEYIQTYLKYWPDGEFAKQANDYLK